MPIAHRVDTECPRCGSSQETWLFYKPEGSVTKECYTCEACGCEWTEID